MGVTEQRQLWNKRYKETGHLWGTDPSETVKHLLAAWREVRERSDDLYRVPSVVTIGAGTGRDEVYLSAHGGANVVAFEIAAAGIALGKRFARDNGANGRIEWKHEDFATSRISRQFDGLASHRTLHLLDDEQVEKFRDKAARWVKPGGVLAVSARNHHDFNPEQMEWISEADGIAKYKDREGHVIRFWDEKKFKTVFGEHFYAETARIQGVQEIESVDNPGVMSSVSVFVATRKLDANNGAVKVHVDRAQSETGSAEGDIAAYAKVRGVMHPSLMGAVVPFSPR